MAAKSLMTDDTNELQFMKLRSMSLIGLVLLVCAGCEATTTGIAVSGTVSRKGKPLETASILFVPKKGTKGQPVGAQIKDGAYQIAAQQGLQAGHYVIEVSLPSPSRKTIMESKRTPKPSSPFKKEREIKAGQNAPINIEL
jgi:hypothetical protein